MRSEGVFEEESRLVRVRVRVRGRGGVRVRVRVRDREELSRPGPSVRPSERSALVTPC